MFVYTDFGMDVVEKLDGMGLKTQVFYQNPEDETGRSGYFSIAQIEQEVSVSSAGGLRCWNGRVNDMFLGWKGLRLVMNTCIVMPSRLSSPQNKTVLDLASGEGYGSRFIGADRGAGGGS